MQVTKKYWLGKSLSTNQCSYSIGYQRCKKRMFNIIENFIRIKKMQNKTSVPTDELEELYNNLK